MNWIKRAGRKKHGGARGVDGGCSHRNDMGVSSGSPLSHHSKHSTRRRFNSPSPASWCSHHATLAPWPAVVGWGRQHCTTGSRNSSFGFVTAAGIRQHHGAVVARAIRMPMGGSRGPRKDACGDMADALCALHALLAAIVSKCPLTRTTPAAWNRAGC